MTVKKRIHIYIELLYTFGINGLINFTSSKYPCRIFPFGKNDMKGWILAETIIVYSPQWLSVPGYWEIPITFHKH